MSSIIARSAFRAAPRAAPRLRPTPGFRRWASAAAEGERESGKQALKTGAKRDPELYVGRYDRLRIGSKTLIGRDRCFSSS